MNKNTSTDQEARETLRQMISDWDAMTPGQQACAIVTAQAAAAAATRNSAVGARFNGRYASGRDAIAAMRTR